MPERHFDPITGLPPHGTLEAFIAVVRSGTFSEAAVSLGMSVSTLSRRVKTLEGYIGCKLLERLHSRARLTPAGRKYYDAAVNALTILESTKNDLASQDTLLLTVTMPHFFAETFLSERLGEFEKNNPDIALSIDTSPVVADMRTDKFDLAIRYGPGNWAGAQTELIFITIGGPACAPTLANNAPLPKRVEALSKHTLLHLSQEPSGWARYFETVGCKGLTGAKNRFFDDGNLYLSAARQGLGIALIDKDISADLLQKGALIRPFGSDISTGDGFHFVYAPNANHNPAVKRFCDWVLSIESVAALRARTTRS